MRGLTLTLCALALAACGPTPGPLASCPEVTLDGEPIFGDCEVWSQPDLEGSVKTTYLYPEANVRLEVWAIPDGRWSAAFVTEDCASIRAYEDSCPPGGTVYASGDGAVEGMALEWVCDCAVVTADL